MESWQHEFLKQCGYLPPPLQGLSAEVLSQMTEEHREENKEAMARALDLQGDLNNGSAITLNSAAIILGASIIASAIDRLVDAINWEEPTSPFGKQ